ncbi:hypothetical protein D0867_09186 [Hortaea werneckii]|uniref:WDR59/RTC1-like RING zinc finger domain-containing protein n=1 Tax=Hortaea werneckii TaxID=91943 RepID=A0A3M7B7Z1_HORWE|nr:hypothetical protein D0868_12575 [Hortaea werneckii]RMY07964.1 hypothetical protein D0867_09186 [Hortaea werneckii]RMY35923.1 hypothetical protein D0866_04287 [Hortaea werneckii]
MEHDERVELQALTSHLITINAEYAAISTRHGIDVIELPNGAIQPIVHRNGRLNGPLIDLCKLQTARLALAQRGQVSVHDIKGRRTPSTLTDTNRAVTSIAWSPHNASVIAIGSIDGSLITCNIDQSQRPLRRWKYGPGPCKSIAWNNLYHDVLATSHEKTIAVWSARNFRRPQRTLRAGHARFLELSWHPSESAKLLSTSDDNVIRVWDLSETLAFISGDASIMENDSDSEDDTIFGEPEGLRRRAFPIAQIPLLKPPRSTQWLGEHGIFVLAEDGRQVVFYSFGSDWEMPHEVWRLKLDIKALTATLQSAEGATMLIAVSMGDVDIHKIPSVIIDNLGGHVHERRQVQPSGSGTHVEQQRSSEDDGPGRQRRLSTMNPLSVVHVRKEETSFKETSKQLQARSRTSKSKEHHKKTPVTSNLSGARSTSPATRMTSSLELPKEQDVNTDSAIPFLSPSIPAREGSLSAIPPLEESLQLSSLHQINSIQSTHYSAARDSDSDDETFADALVGSGSYLPGGINVPLPKACGALFAPSGQLVTFFPPKSTRQNAPRTGDKGEMVGNKERSKARRAAQLFPTFGNLISNDDISDSETSSGSSVASHSNGSLPPMAMDASMETGRSWQHQDPRMMPSEPTATGNKVVISTHDIEDFVPVSKITARDYRVLRGAESSSDMCYANGRIAEEVGLADTASVWRLLALLLEDAVPLDVVSQGQDQECESILVVAQRSRRSLRQNSLADSQEASSSGKLRWADHPFAASWLVRRMLQWAEDHADIQMLACIPTILAQASQVISEINQTAFESMFTKLATYDPDYLLHSDTSKPPPSKSRPIPFMRSESYQSSRLQQTPVRTPVVSQTSSGVPSQPPTPQIGSTSSTPPTTFPPLPRPNSNRLSTSMSGSASPERYRGSFSAAAKYYAQSITDKFSSYGSSPPARRFGTSPSANDLSTSVPTPHGSWSKSVSFASAAASTVGTARNSQLSRSNTDAEGYDSDKTIDDSSLPQTPKSTNAPVLPKFFNLDSFSDEVSGGGAKSSFLPEDLAAKAVVWQDHYAELLRCWGLWMQAAELEKAAGLARSGVGFDDGWSHDGIVPISVPGSRQPACSICYAVITGVQQLCPECLHTNHLGCLIDYCDFLDGEAFECPTGCGCDCAGLPLEQVGFC